MNVQVAAPVADGSEAGAADRELPPIMIVETIEETHGWPVRDPGVELAGEPLPVLRVVRMLFMPWIALCEWPRLLLRTVAPRDGGAQR